LLTLAVLASASSLYVNVQQGPCPNCYIASVYVEAPLSGQVALYSVHGNHWKYERTLCNVTGFAACNAAFLDVGWDAFGFHVWRDRFYGGQWSPVWMFGIDVYNATCNKIEVAKVEVKEGEVYVYALVPSKRGVAVFRSGSTAVRVEVVHPYHCALLRFGLGKEYVMPGSCVTIDVNGSEVRTVCPPALDKYSLTVTAVGSPPAVELRASDALEVALVATALLAASALLAKKTRRV